jgi:hypothetical protein
MNTTDTLGYVASSAVLVTFLMTRMTPLRVVAIVSNLLFIAFGFMQQIYPVFFLHLILLPINVWRLFALNTAAAARPTLAAARIAPAYARRYGVWVSLGLLAGLVSVTTVLALGVPGYDNLARVHQASFSFSRFNPVTNAVRVMKSAKAHILAEDRKPTQPLLAAKSKPIAI